MSDALVKEPVQPPGAARGRQVLRGALVTASEIVARDVEAFALSLENDDDIGARHHFGRLVQALRTMAPKVKELGSAQ